jgi:hypothetical protein
MVVSPMIKIRPAMLQRHFNNTVLAIMHPAQLEALCHITNINILNEASDTNNYTVNYTFLIFTAV